MSPPELGMHYLLEDGRYVEVRGGTWRYVEVVEPQRPGNCRGCGFWDAPNQHCQRRSEVPACYGEGLYRHYMFEEQPTTKRRHVFK